MSVELTCVYTDNFKKVICSFWTSQIHFERIFTLVSSNPAHGKSNAKIILIGEHAVVYGQPAIALPLTTVNVKVTVEDAETESTINSSYFTGKLADFPVSGIKHLINYLIDKNEIENPLSITI